MKKSLIAASLAGVFAGTFIFNNASQISHQAVNHQSKLNVSATLSDTNRATQNLLKDGKNAWDEYFFYTVVFLNHDLTLKINKAIIEGDFAGTLLILANLPGAAGSEVFIPQIATVLTFMWPVGGIEPYDGGNGVAFSFLSHLIWVKTWAQ